MELEQLAQLFTSFSLLLLGSVFIFQGGLTPLGWLIFTPMTIGGIIGFIANLSRSHPLKSLFLLEEEFNLEGDKLPN